jgi:hypothetical protein
VLSRLRVATLRSGLRSRPIDAVDTNTFFARTASMPIVTRLVLEDAFGDP